MLRNRRVNWCCSTRERSCEFNSFRFHLNPTISTGSNRTQNGPPRNGTRRISSSSPRFSSENAVFEKNEGPLRGLKILDMGRILAAPYCSMVLGDLGAEVYKIEHPISGDDTRSWGPPFTESGGESAYFLSVNRNKKSIAVDLKKKEGLQVVYDLAKVCDIAIENFPPGKAEALKIDYHNLSKINPKIIYASLTGYGPDGPYANRLAYDVMVSAIGGLLGITGPENGDPCKVGVAITDICCGLFCHGAILAALYSREQTGKGQKIDISLLESQVATLANVGSNYLIGGVETKPKGTAHSSIVPYQAFATKNGHMVVGALNDQQFHRLCEVMGHLELANDPLFLHNEDRVKHRDRLIPLLQSEFEKCTTSDWMEKLENARIPYGPINTMKEVFSDPQVLHRKMLEEVNHPTAGNIRLAGIPVKYSDTKPSIRLPPPILGQHTREILRNVLKYDEETISKLKSDGVCVFASIPTQKTNEISHATSY